MDKEKRKLYYQENRAHILATAKKWRLNNPEKVKAQRERAQQKLIEKIKTSVIEEKKNRPPMPQDEILNFEKFIIKQFSDYNTYKEFMIVIKKAYKHYPQQFPAIFNKVKQYKKMYNIKSSELFSKLKRRNLQYFQANF